MAKKLDPRLREILAAGIEQPRHRLMAGQDQEHWSDGSGNRSWNHASGLFDVAPMTYDLNGNRVRTVHPRDPSFVTTTHYDHRDELIGELAAESSLRMILLELRVAEALGVWVRAWPHAAP